MSDKIELSKEELRNLQLLELEMIVEVDRICRKHHIQYSLDGGTLLGAIRHKGFIPWDDDADVIFTRHEYAKFYRACKNDLDKERFFLQDYRTDSEYRWGYAKLRRKGTEYVRVNQEQLNFKTGVCIDIFVVDNMPDSVWKRKLFYAVNYCIRKVLYSELGKSVAPNAVLRNWYKILNVIPKKAMFSLRNIGAKHFNKQRTQLVSHLLFPYPCKRCKYGMPSSCFDSYIETEFEGMQLKVFEKYDEYLSLLYGEYMQMPPVEKQVGCADACRVEMIPISLEEIRERYQKENVIY